MVKEAGTFAPWYKRQEQLPMLHPCEEHGKASAISDAANVCVYKAVVTGRFLLQINRQLHVLTALFTSLLYSEQLAD